SGFRSRSSRMVTPSGIDLNSSAFSRSAAAGPSGSSPLIPPMTYTRHGPLPKSAATIGFPRTDDPTRDHPGGAGSRLTTGTSAPGPSAGSPGAGMFKSGDEHA